MEVSPQLTESELALLKTTIVPEMTHAQLASMSLSVSCLIDRSFPWLNLPQNRTYQECLTFYLVFFTKEDFEDHFTVAEILEFIHRSPRVTFGILSLNEITGNFVDRLLVSNIYETALLPLFSITRKHVLQLLKNNSPSTPDCGGLNELSFPCFLMTFTCFLSTVVLNQNQLAPYPFFNKLFLNEINYLIFGQNWLGPWMNVVDRNTSLDILVDSVAVDFITTQDEEVTSKKEYILHIIKFLRFLPGEDFRHAEILHILKQPSNLVLSAMMNLPETRQYALSILTDGNKFDKMQILFDHKTLDRIFGGVVRDDYTKVVQILDRKVWEFKSNPYWFWKRDLLFKKAFDKLISNAQQALSKGLLDVHIDLMLLVRSFMESRAAENTDS